MVRINLYKKSLFYIYTITMEDVSKNYDALPKKWKQTKKCFNTVQIIKELVWRFP